MQPLKHGILYKLNKSKYLFGIITFTSMRRVNYYLPLGIAIGAGIGVAMNNIAIGMGVGVALGVALSGVARSRNNRQ